MYIAKNTPHRSGRNWPVESDAVITLKFNLAVQKNSPVFCQSSREVPNIKSSGVLE